MAVLKQGNELYSESNRSQNILCVAARWWLSFSDQCPLAPEEQHAWDKPESAVNASYYADIFFAPDDFIFMLWVKKSTYPLKAQLILMEACIHTLKQSHLMFRSLQQTRVLEDLHVLPLFRFLRAIIGPNAETGLLLYFP